MGKKTKMQEILLYGQTEEGVEASMERCGKCKYRGSGECGCDYLGMTGRARILVSPGVGEECTAFAPMTGEPERKRAQMTIRPNAGERREAQEARGRERVFRQMKAMYEEGMSDRAIAAELHVSPTSVKRWRGREGLSVNNHGSIPDKVQAERKAAAKELWARGGSDSDIAQALGVSPRTVAKWRYDMGLPSHDREGKEANRANE